MNDLRDPVAYRIAIGFLGLAVAVALGGIAWTAGMSDEWVPSELWFAAGILGGVFVGALIPFSLHPRLPCTGTPECASCDPSPGSLAALFLLVAVCIVATTVGLACTHLALSGLGATVAGVLLGLPIPSPAEGARRHHC